SLDGPLGRHIRKSFSEANLVCLEKSWNHGFRQVTSSTRPILKPDDLNGFKIRVPPSPLWTSMFKAFGAYPVSIAWAETYSAMQTKIADGLEQPLIGLLVDKMYEVQKHCSLTNHMWDGFWILSNKRVWEGIPANLREIIERNINEEALRQRAEVEQMNATLQSELQKRGLEFHKVDNDAFRDKLVAAGSVGHGWGNGKATATLFAREGAHVVCVDFNPDAAQETAGIIKGEGGSASVATCDVTKSAQVKSVVDDVIAARGRIDVLHNNVGYAIMGGPIELSEEEWHKTIDLNITGCFITCKHVLPHMLARGSGAIVNVSSIAAIRWTGYPYAAYYAAKAAVNNFTMGLALQYARDGIRANAVMPGLMNTPLIHQQISGQYENAEDMVRARDAACPMGRMGTAWDVARAALFLASDEASYITGVSLPVDGGLTCRAA